MSTPMHPPEQALPTGYCVRLVSIVGDKELCQELSWFFGTRAHIDATAHFTSCLDPESYGAVGDLRDGKYRLSLHEAWRGNENTPHEYNDTGHLGQITFLLSRVVNLRAFS